VEKERLESFFGELLCLLYNRVDKRECRAVALLV
jgi:hypothetical protein